MTAEGRRAAYAAAGGSLILLGLAWWKGWLDSTLLKTTGGPRLDDPVADSLARLILTESSASGVGGPEGAGVAYVGLRTARARGHPSVEAAVTEKGGKAWFGKTRAAGYCYFTSSLACPGRTRGARTVRSSPLWPKASAQAARIVTGAEPDPAPGRMHFYAPEGMDRCDTPGARKGGTDYRICVDTPSGLRWAPGWGLSVAQGGTANNPVRVGASVFSGFGAPLPWWGLLLPIVPP